MRLTEKDCPYAASRSHSSPRSPRHWRSASRDTQGRRWPAGNPGMRLTKQEMFLALEQPRQEQLLHLRPQRQEQLSHLRPSTKNIISCQAVAGLKNALTSQVTTPLAQRLPAHGVGNGLQVTWHAFHPAHPHACFSTAGVTGRRGPGLQTQGTCGACQHRSSDTVLAGAAGSLIWLD